VAGPDEQSAKGRDTHRNLDRERGGQLELPFAADDGRALDAALDQVRDRFGSGAITRAVLLGKDQGPSMPLLPD